ncbi:FAD dependent oxidoreductase [Plectosphaerella plurivora]|uniref:FAD dependent oxidoreductase n=1 Tax=Plectosphaerella plurivora TaxID=936078 RepID=A0A9P8V9M2_9PEZI|nr:FAD dependent oxidoreductase [Plectosphaerella plurivora]
MSQSDFVRHVAELIIHPPSLPSPEPTSSAWQNPPHPSISNAQSPVLTEATDVAIIGSGVTGIAVAHFLLNHPGPRPPRVTMLEARTAVSGATGRNGGHLVSDSDALFPGLVKSTGLEKAIETVRFSEANIRRLRLLASQLNMTDDEAAELRTVAATTAYEEEDIFEEAVAAVRQLEEAVPDRDLTYLVYGKEEAEKMFGFPNMAGVIQQRGVAALWPYRFFTAVLAALDHKFPTCFQLETNTPVQEVVHEDDPSLSHPYLLRTPRGSLRAKHVVHCTNGYSAHLLPGLIGTLYPLRGTMSTQDMGPVFPRQGNRLSWHLFSKATYDASTGYARLGLYYAQQNVKSGLMFLGGEAQKLTGLLTSDDSSVADDAWDSLASAAPGIWKVDQPPKVVDLWSGIMGFTADGMPLVGNVPPKISGRGGHGEWIAAGFNGHGMDKCWLSGEAVARMLLGQIDVPEFPRAYLLTEERIASWTPEMAAETLMEHVQLDDDHIKQ